jgi:hypothetical protein
MTCVDLDKYNVPQALAPLVLCFSVQYCKKVACGEREFTEHGGVNGLAGAWPKQIIQCI